MNERHDAKAVEAAQADAFNFNDAMVMVGYGLNTVELLDDQDHSELGFGLTLTGVHPAIQGVGVIKTLISTQDFPAFACHTMRAFQRAVLGTYGVAEHFNEIDEMLNTITREMPAVRLRLYRMGPMSSPAQDHPAQNGDGAADE